ncbi:metallophosphoesterase family protein [Caldivirga maquilingensis]|uniref:Metallophosphoesterase n=1 Tax=Caldivirga maquilingensis (strain ATCC 700844 / DSM 13496 / JCM 10307 / IC-167) TaxID=397948 RepID=A8MDQ3_CALMQ|nr:DNA repair exonuclease [Caldivirga maquilingensis]ABW01909.1 metallophosphoesterase [Caldivirga maquilingensis IC-167]
MLIAHISDVHLGRRQYGLEARARDYEAAFLNAISEIIKLREERGVDVVLVTGDLFDNPRPSPSTYLTAIKGFSRLRDSGLNVIITRGNHDASVINPVDNPISVLSSSGLVKYLDLDYIDYGKLRIIGVGCVPGSEHGKLTRGLRGLMGGGLNIVMMHQYIEGAPYRYPMPNIDYYSIPADELPIDAYYAVGHIHEHALRHPSLNAVYPGSLEIWDSQEFETYVLNNGKLSKVKEQDPKGFLLLDVNEGAGRVKVEPVRLHGGRRMIKVLVNINGESPSVFREHLSELSSLNYRDAYVEVNVTGELSEGFSVRDYGFNTIKGLISDALKVNVKLTVTRRSSVKGQVVHGLIELIQSVLGKNLGNEAMVNAVLRALDLVSDGKVNEARVTLEKALGIGDDAEWLQWS